MITAYFTSVPSLYGVCIGGSMDTTERALLDAAGINALRLDCQNSARWTYALNSGLNILGIFSPHRTMSSIPNWTLTEWVAMVDSKVRANPQVRFWEVCNEITLKQFQGTSGYFYGCTNATLPPLYTNLLKATYQKIKSIDPTLTVVGFSGLQTGLWGWDTTDSSQTMTDKSFLTQCIALGALPYCDAVSFHTYPGTAAEPPSNTLTTIDGHIKEIKTLVGAKELWCSEWGISVKNCVGSTTQSTWINSISTIFKTNSITKSFHYTWKDDVYTPTNPMGLITINLTTKPSYDAYKLYIVI